MGPEHSLILFPTFPQLTPVLMNSGHSHTLNVITAARVCACVSVGVSVRVGKRGPRPQTVTVEAPQWTDNGENRSCEPEPKADRKQLETWLPPQLTTDAPHLGNAESAEGSPRSSLNLNVYRDSCFLTVRVPLMFWANTALRGNGIKSDRS